MEEKADLHTLDWQRKKGIWILESDSVVPLLASCIQFAI